MSKRNYHVVKSGNHWAVKSNGMTAFQEVAYFWGCRDS